MGTGHSGHLGWSPMPPISAQRDGAGSVWGAGGTWRCLASPSVSQTPLSAGTQGLAREAREGGPGPGGTPVWTASGVWLSGLLAPWLPWAPSPGGPASGLLTGVRGRDLSRTLGNYRVPPMDVSDVAPTLGREEPGSGPSQRPSPGLSHRAPPAPGRPPSCGSGFMEGRFGPWRRVVGTQHRLADPWPRWTLPRLHGSWERPAEAGGGGKACPGGHPRLRAGTRGCCERRGPEDGQQVAAAGSGHRAQP